MDSCSGTTTNNEHRHSRIKFVTPNQRHTGEDKAILEQRAKLYQKKQMSNAERWSGNTRNWKPIGDVYLNPEKAKAEDQQSQAA